MHNVKEHNNTHHIELDTQHNIFNMLCVGFIAVILGAYWSALGDEAALLNGYGTRANPTKLC